MQKHKTTSIRRRASGLILPLTLLAAWQAAALHDESHQYTFVPLEQIGAASIELIRNGELFIDLGASLRRTTIGLASGTLTGIALGAGMALSPFIQRLLQPLFQGMRYVPLLGLIPLLSLWAGNGDFAKTFVVTLAALYPVATSSFDSLRRIDMRFIELAKSYELTRTERLRDVLLPAMMPELFTGVLQAVPIAWITATSSELLFNAGAGVGNLMQNAQAGARVDVLLVCVLGVTALAVAMSALCERVARRVLRWRDQA
ncbi:ABC transporter permease [Paraburkholderia pallida]|uniref:ABC transporter permease n=1 Tax=Paraburkholderia pallida TaxID=2547399 RepID=A0A4P7CXX2_9BURK|nr:ABC transporter permease [Paraburkholderia pallida]QBQ98873.1 ABC transporter permease [Paraburkholderia pallida]